MGFLGLFNSRTSIMGSGVLQGATDRHSHILFGVDDGIQTLEESLSALAREEELGVEDVWCTPHVMEDVPNTTEALKARFAELQSAYKGNIKLHLAAEYMIDTVFEERLSNGDFLTMENNTVLVETSTWSPPFDLLNQLRELQKKGYNPLLAHPERYRYMANEDYEELIRLGVRFQLNLPSIVGYYGKTAQEKASWLLKKDMYSAIGTDCHKDKALGEPYMRELLSREDMKKLKTVCLPERSKGKF